MDTILHQYFHREKEKEVLFKKVLAYSAMSGASSKEMIEEITGLWNNYVHLEYNTGMKFDRDKEDREHRMLREYEMIKQMKPKMSIDKDGGFKVSGLDVPYVADKPK